MDERTRVAIGLLAAETAQDPASVEAYFPHLRNPKRVSMLRAADYALSLRPPATVERRVPVCMTEGDNYLTVACSDGTIWASIEAGKKWKELPPIPQPTTPAPVSDPVAQSVYPTVPRLPPDTLPRAPFLALLHEAERICLELKSYFGEPAHSARDRLSVVASVARDALEDPIKDPVREALAQLINQASLILAGRSVEPGSVMYCALGDAVDTVRVALAETKP